MLRARGLTAILAFTLPSLLTRAEELAGQVAGRVGPLQPLQEAALAAPASSVARGVLGGECVEVPCEHEGRCTRSMSRGD